MIKDCDCANDAILPPDASNARRNRLSISIYDPEKCRDPDAVSMWSRADQLCGMCKVLICAHDTAMNIDLLEGMRSQFEVMYQLADELRQGLELP